MLILFLCPWKFMVMESDWFNANESHATARCLPFVLNTKSHRLRAFVLVVTRCFASPPVSVVENSISLQN